MVGVKNLILVLTVIVLSNTGVRAQGNTSVTSSNDPCGTSHKCGPFGVCNLEESPVCSCLPEYYPTNKSEWDSGNWSSGCSRRTPFKCEEAVSNETSRNDGFFKLPMMNLLLGRRMDQENQCAGQCLRDCSCLAYVHDDNIRGCMFWSGTLFDVRKSTSSTASDLYVRVSNSGLGHKKGSKKIITILVVFVGFVIVSISSLFSWKLMAKRRGRKETIELGREGAFAPVNDTSLKDTLSQVNLQELPLFKFEILATATNNFSEANKLGKGGFGPVYKGELNGRDIAVKRLSQASGQGMHEFMNEVMLISKLQHRNLVRLLGCCVEQKETMLIYEYMSNKSLDFFLFDTSHDILDWRKRCNIIEGICRGLLYLHRDSRTKIIHRDLKPSNILLDNEWNPKISDFGLARIFEAKQDHVSTIRVVGTYGYMAPEYAIQGRFSEKSDVFSFGVLLLEIATGRRNTSFHHQDGPLNLLGHVWNLWKEDNVSASIDPRIASPRYQSDIERCIHIGLLCVQELPIDRPSVSAVLSMLCSETIELPEPKQPAFTTKSCQHDTGTNSSHQSQRSSSSLNDVTLSTIGGR